VADEAWIALALLHRENPRSDGFSAREILARVKAAAAGVDLFITNDNRLSKRIVPGISFITSLKEAPL